MALAQVAEHMQGGAISSPSAEAASAPGHGAAGSGEPAALSKGAGGDEDTSGMQGCGAMARLQLLLVSVVPA